MRTKTLGILFSIAITIFSVSAVPVRAQSAKMSVAPARRDIVAKPGSAFVLTYTIANGGDPVYLKAGVRPIVPSGTIGSIELTPQNTTGIPFEGMDDGSALDTPFFLTSKETITVPITVTVPETQKEADYYFAFYAQTEPPPGIEGDISVRVSERILSLINITVSRTGYGEIKPKIALFDIAPDRSVTITGGYRLVDSENAVPVRLVLANNGANAFTATGTLVTSHPFGATTTQIAEQRVLASAVKTVDLTPVVIPFFGTTTLALSLDYGDSGVKNYSRITFVAIPFRLWPVPVVFLLVIILIAARNARHPRRIRNRP